MSRRLALSRSSLTLADVDHCVSISPARIGSSCLDHFLCCYGCYGVCFLTPSSRNIATACSCLSACASSCVWLCCLQGRGQHFVLLMVVRGSGTRVIFASGSFWSTTALPGHAGTFDASPPPRQSSVVPGQFPARFARSVVFPRFRLRLACPPCLVVRLRASVSRLRLAAVCACHRSGRLLCVIPGRMFGAWCVSGAGFTGLRIECRPLRTRRHRSSLVAISLKGCGLVRSPLLGASSHWQQLRQPARLGADRRPRPNHRQPGAAAPHDSLAHVLGGWPGVPARPACCLMSSSAAHALQATSAKLAFC